MSTATIDTVQANTLRALGGSSHAQCRQCGQVYVGLVQMIMRGRSQCPKCFAANAKPISSQKAKAILEGQDAPAPKSTQSVEEQPLPSETVEVKKEKKAKTEKTESGEAKPETKSKREKVFGKYGTCETIRWMSKQGRTAEQILKCLTHLLAVAPTESTVKGNIGVAKKGTFKGKALAPDIQPTKAEQDKLLADWA